MCYCWGMFSSRALKAGVKAPLLLLPSHPTFRQSELVTLLGALEALYVVSDHGSHINSVHSCSLWKLNNWIVRNMAWGNKWSDMVTHLQEDFLVSLFCSKIGQLFFTLGLMGLFQNSYRVNRLTRKLLVFSNST
jgi:hypothetical protein